MEIIRHGSRWNHGISNAIIDHMLKPNPHYFTPPNRRLTQEHRNCCFIRKDLLEAVREKYPDVKEETFDIHLKDLVEIRWINRFSGKTKTWLREKNRHVTPVVFYSIRKKWLKYRNEANRCFSFGTFESVDISD